MRSKATGRHKVKSRRVGAYKLRPAEGRSRWECFRKISATDISRLRSGRAQLPPPPLPRQIRHDYHRVSELSTIRHFPLALATDNTHVFGVIPPITSEPL